MANKVNFTKPVLDTFDCPETQSEAYLKDTGQPGLLYRVRASGHRSFEVRRKLKGKAHRTKLGTYPLMSIPEARRKAREALIHYDRGVSPKASERASQAARVTLREALNDYIGSRSSLRPSTARSYVATLDQYLSDWLDEPLINITRDAVEARHKKIGKASQSRANSTMRMLRAVFNYAIAKYEDEHGEPLFLHNPVARLGHVKAWYPEQRRKTYLNKQQLPVWFEAVETLPTWMMDERSEAKTVGDLLLLILFTGFRRREASNLTWDDVDLENETIRVKAERSKNSQEHILPLPPFLVDLLKHRAYSDSSYVFPGRVEGNPINEPKRVLQAVRRRTGIKFTIHDLRRTFATMAEDAGVRDYTLKKLLNHSGGRDVTAGYYVPDVDALREPMNRICDHILRICQR